MQIRSLILCMVVSSLLANTTHAQIYSFGGRAGANYSKISNLSTIILSEPYFINYTIKEASRIGWHLGIFYEYKLEDERLGFDSEIMYSAQGGDVEFNNYDKDFNYKMQFAYQYINIVGLAKWFPYSGSINSCPLLSVHAFISLTPDMIVLICALDQVVTVGLSS